MTITNIAQKNIITPNEWSPASWRKLPIRQQPQYDDAQTLAKVEAELAALPALVSPAEVRNLKEEEIALKVLPNLMSVICAISPV
jgi:3-deoxy-D-arabino-heptulosonate 7-phosphate (DAHP) synthase class II